jgi:hypothetical protein
MSIRHGGGSAGREGGGGGIVCCMMLPWSWKPDLTVEVRWTVGKWPHEFRLKTTAGGYREGATSEMYLAKVLVEKYEDPSDLYVHFFPHGRVRVMSTMHSVLSPYHPVPYGPNDGGPAATSGNPIREIFTQAEISEMQKTGKVHGNE